jgi:phospholipase D1/2
MARGWGKHNITRFGPNQANMFGVQRDYYWNLSRALNMAKERVYIHDCKFELHQLLAMHWIDSSLNFAGWISPELYLRRPGNERYRLDNLLKRKAEEGVKIFIII